MIIVIEGPSAVGKTTLLQRMPHEQIVSEDWDALGFPRSTWPDLHTPEGQHFGLTMLARRWELLLAAEARFGQAYGDTDPVKLYYDFALVSLGRITLADFAAEFKRTRQAFAEHRLGFADHVIFLSAAPAVLQQRKAGDTSRRRGNFDLHLRMIESFADYYATLARLRPGTVHPADATRDSYDRITTLIQTLVPAPTERYDIERVDQLQDELGALLDQKAKAKRGIDP